MHTDVGGAHAGWGATQFDHWANAILYYCNFTVAMVVLVGVVVLYGVLHVWRKPQHAAILQIVVLVHAFGTLYIALTALAAFTLTKTPPLVRAFEPSEWRIVGAYMCLSGLFYGLYQTARVFRVPFGGRAAD